MANIDADFITNPVANPASESPVSPRSAPSAARVAANRRNAARSTGPRTEEGKRRSRANAVKHGLAGAGICLPSEDAALVEERCLQLHEEMAPTTVQGMMLVEAIALAHTRMKRAARQEVASLSFQQRHAVAAFNDARLSAAEDDLHHLSLNTATRYRHLLGSPEGIDLLIARLGDVRREIRRTDIRWSYIHGQCLDRFCGRDSSDRFHRSRGWALSLALEFDPSELTDDDRAAIDAEFGGRIRDWAILQMEVFIDEEVARLGAIRATLDHDAIARDRAEAAERVMFDAGRDAALARRYEAAATRTFFRAMKEYRQLEAGADPAAPSALDEPAATTAEVLLEGDAIPIPDPADRAEPPPPPRRSFERPPLASSGITVEQASIELSQPHFSQPPIPVHLPIPPLVAVLPPLRRD